MEPNRLTPRIARHVDAIAIARLAGVTWQQIATLFGTTADTLRLAYARARAGLASGRYVVQQMPLPEPPAVSRDTPADAPARQEAKSGAAASTQHRQSTKEFLASLEQIGGNKK